MADERHSEEVLTAVQERFEADETQRDRHAQHRADNQKSGYGEGVRAARHDAVNSAAGTGDRRPTR